jgi:hypothetical protein
MTSHVMLNNGAAYVLDCGLGVTDQYALTGIPFSAMRSIFIPFSAVRSSSLIITPTTISSTARC